MTRPRIPTYPAADRSRRDRPPRWGSLAARLSVLAVAAVVGWSVLAFGLQYLRTYTLAREAASLERHRRDLLVQNGVLLAEIRRLRTDDQYIEQLARQQLGMLRPGEIELVIVNAAPTKRHSERDPASSQISQPADPRDSAKRWLQDLAEQLRAAAERMLTHLHLAAP